MPAPARGRVIAQVGRLVEANKEALSRLVTREIGKPYAESLGEVQEIIDTCDFFLGEGRRLYGQTVPSEMPDKQLFTFRMPVGVAAIITAGNFPVAVPSWYLVPAILCGNAVVWKPAEYSAAIGHALAQLFHAGGVPEGVLNLVHADGAQTFAGLERALEQRLVDKVGFTGSSAVGAEIGALCGRHLQSPCLELGGKNPMVVMDDADLDLAVEGALFAGFGTAGPALHVARHRDRPRPTCTTSSCAGSTSACARAAIGDPTQDVLYGPMLARALRRALRGVARPDPRPPHRATARARWAGSRADAPREGFVGDPEAGIFYHPTFVTGVTAEDELYCTETFGPLVGVARFDELRRGDGAGQRPRLRPLVGDLHDLAARTPSASASGSARAWSRSTTPRRAPRRTCPFGGNGKSGNGSRQSGIWVLDQFTRWQSMNWDYAGKLQKAQMDVVEIEAEEDFRLEERAF